MNSAVALMLAVTCGAVPVLAGVLSLVWSTESDTGLQFATRLILGAWLVVMGVLLMVGLYNKFYCGVFDTSCPASATEYTVVRVNVG